MSSLIRINANRANAAKSRGPVTPEGKQASAANSAHSTGPVTPEGKARVSQNAVKHGLLAKSVVLPNECAESFEAGLTALRECLQPRDYVENELVEIMHSANWRRKRAWHIERSTLANAIQTQQQETVQATPVAETHDQPVQDEVSQPPAPVVSVQIAAPDPAVGQETAALHTALAFSDLCDRPGGLRTLHRYEVRLSREFIRHLNILESRRAAATPPVDAAESMNADGSRDVRPV